MRAGIRFSRLVSAGAVVVGLIAAAPAQAGFSLAPAFTGSISQPMYVTSPPGDSHRLFIVTRPGVIRVAVDGVLQTTPFLDIHTRVWTTGEAGMLSMAFDPGYENPTSAGYGLFYVYFVQVPGSGETNGAIHIEEFRTDPATSPNVASPTSARTVLLIPHNDASNHYGGTLQFNPNDGLLYIGTGDGGGSDNQFGNAQDTKKSLLGKLLRIDPHVSGANPYSIPLGNPFHGQPLCNPPSGTNCPEILAWGLRNPFRWSFDRTTGDIAIGDVGQGQWEEVDYVPASATLAGDNFGWPCFEGPVAYKSCTADPRVDPVFAYSHTGLTGSIAITGGVVVRDPALGPLTGRYLYADFFAGIIHSVQLATPSATGDRVETDFPKVGSLVSFGQDADGHVYVVSLAGSVQRITCDSACALPPSGGGGGGPVGPEPPAQPSTPTPLRDTTAPHLSLRAARLQDVLRRGVVRVSVDCDESCFVRAGGKARGQALLGVLRHLSAGRRTVLELRAPKRVRRALARSGVITISVRGRDAAGNLRVATLTVRVKRG